MEEKKFTKSYYSQPDRLQKVDILIGRGYKNLEVHFNGKKAAEFANSDILEQSQEINFDGHIIHVRYLPKTMEFEIFLNGTQIDDSATSPKKVLNSLQIPFIVGIVWYLVIILFAMRIISPLMAFRGGVLANLLSAEVFYYITSSTIVIASVIGGWIFLKNGSSNLYLFVMIVVSMDLIYGLIYQILAISIMPGQFKLLLILGVLTSLIAKSTILFFMIRNWTKFKTYALNVIKTKEYNRSQVLD
ncbi:MAG: hypothetical protein IPM77_06805 [Crocinitomicaceae bacterium]|nr:hypothetical protein [Crocinitomicaceae bacterium]